MRLSEWLRETEMKPKEAAARLGVLPTSFSRYLLAPDHPNFRRPTNEVMSAIYELTGGAVQPNDFYELPEPDAAEQLSRRGGGERDGGEGGGQLAASPAATSQAATSTEEAA